VHLREDRRHIQDEDVRRLRTHTQIKLNFEMAATKEMVAIACAVKPEMAMLVPEGRQEITTEGGLDLIANRKSLAVAIETLRKSGITVSAFVDADLKQIKMAADLGVQVCEIHTGPYAAVFDSQGRDAQAPAVIKEINKIAKAGEKIMALGMRFNAGHALNYFNVQPIAALSGVRELHIGHAIVSRAVFTGIREAVREMKRLMREAANR
jgi:pyridoxine 5-phosphate synthase